jgi:hypothetical protein
MHVCNNATEVDNVLARAKTYGDPVHVVDRRDSAALATQTYPSLVQLTFYEHHSTHVLDELVMVVIVPWKIIDKDLRATPNECPPHRPARS